MTIQFLFSSLFLMITLLQIFFAGYIFVLNPKSPGNRTLASLLLVLSFTYLAENFLQSTFTVKDATPWIILIFAGSNAIGPWVYLTSVAILRPHWFQKYGWLYWPITGLLFLPTLVLIFDLTGLSQALIGNFLIITLPEANTFTTANELIQTANQGLLYNYFFISQIGFPTLTLICPSLVVAWKDRKVAPANSRLGFFFFLATLLSGVLQSGSFIFIDPTIATTLATLIFFILSFYITLTLTSFSEQTRQIQKTFRRWSVFAKLMGVIILVIAMMTVAIGITTYTVLRINTIRSEGRNLRTLALAETRNLGTELLVQITQLQELAQNAQLTSAIEKQNRLYDAQTPEVLADELAALELEWQTSNKNALTTKFLYRDLLSYNVLLNFRKISPAHLLLYITDKRGLVVTGTVPPERYNATQNNWWQIAKNQGVPYISSPLFDATAHLYYVEIAIPILDATDQFQGMLFSRYNLQPILDRIANIRFGETGQVALYNSLGLQLPTSPDQPPIDTDLNWQNLDTLPEAWQVLPYLGQDSVIAWTQIGTLYTDGPLNDLQWRILFTKTTEETLASIRLINSTSNLVLLGTVLLSLVFAGTLSRIITYPLNELSQTASRISQGDLKLRAETLTEDEFGTLAKSFNLMTGQLQTSIEGLEQQVFDRTKALQQRAGQIRAAVEIGNTVASIREINELLPKVTQLISEKFNFYHIGIFLLDETQEFAVLRAANSHGGQRMLARQHQLKIGEVGIVGYVAKNKLPRIALDVGEDAVFFNNPDLPETRSEMGLPLLSAGKILGVLDVQSTQSQAFSQEDITFLQLLADQLAVTIDNATLFALNQTALADTQNALEAARRAYRDLSREGWENLSRETHTLAFRANAKELIPLSAPPAPGLVHAARAGHPTLSSPEALAIPIKIQEYVAGVVQLKKKPQEIWSAEEVNLIETIVNQLGTALEGARLYKETQSSLIRTEALYQVGRAAVAYENPKDLLQAVADTIAGTLPASRVLILTADFVGEKVLHFIENNAAIQEITPNLFHNLMDGLSGWAIRQRRPAISSKNFADTREGPDAQKHRRENRLGSIIVVPMYYQDTPLGTITAINQDTEPDFSQEDAELLTAMTNQLAASLTNTELLLQTRKRALQLQTSAEISRAASSILELDQLLPQAVELIRNRFSFYYVGIFLVDDAQTWAILRAGTGDAGKAQIEQGYRLALDDSSLLSQCLVSAQPRIALDMGVDAVEFDNPFLPLTRSEIILPLTSRTGTIGAITIQSTLPAAFTLEDLSVFQTMADQLASAIDNAILFEANRRRLQTSSTLLEITQVVATSIRINQILREITQRTAKVTQAYRCMVYLIGENNYVQPTMAQFADGHTDAVQWERFLALPQTQLADIPLFANTLSERRPILVSQALTHPEIIPLEWARPFHQETILCVPLINQDRGIGILMLDQISPFHSFNQEQIDLALTIAGQAAAIIQNARLFEEQEKSAKELKQLNDISLELSQLQMDLAPAIDTLSKRAMELLDADGGGIWFWRGETQELELVQAFQNNNTQNVGLRLKYGEGLSGKAYATRQLQVIDDYLTWEGHSEKFARTPFHAALAVPLIQQNEVLGVLVVNRSQPGNPFTLKQQNLALLLANQTAAYIRTARLFQETQDALAREQRERRIATTLAEVAEKFGTAYGEHKIRQTLIDEILDLVSPDQITLYEWRDDHNAFKVAIRLAPGGNEDEYQTDMIIGPDARHDLLQVFTTREKFYSAQPRADGLIHEQFIFPWLSGNLVNGVIEIYHTALHANIRNQDQEAILGIVRQAAVAIQSARLFEQTQEALTRTEALYQVSQSATAVESLPVLLQAIVDRIAMSLPADRVLLITLDQDSQQVTGFVESGLPTGSIVPLAFDELMQGLTGWVIRERKPALSVKTQTDERESENVRQHRVGAKAGSILVVPLIYRDQIFGTMTATNEVDNPDFTNEDLNLLNAMANQAAAAIENARLLNQTQRRAILLQTAAEVSNAASSILELDQLLPQVVELIRDRFNLYYVGLFLVDDIRRYAVLRAGTGEAGKVQIEQKHRLRLNQDSMIGRCILEAQAQIAQQIEAGTVLFRNPHLPDTRAELALPLSASGQTVGAMTIQSTQPTAFTADDITVLETLADQLAIAIENARFVAETRIRAENERILSQITTQLSRSLDLETILQTAVQEIGHLANVREVAIHLGGLQPLADTDEIENFVTESQHGLRIISSTQKP